MSNPGDIAITTIRHRELAGLVADIRANPGRYPVVPVSPARAATHAANPDADPDDPALLLVMLDGCCRGYLGLMPHRVPGPDAPRKVFAFSTLLVDAPLRGSGVADRLLECARRCGPLLTIGNSNAAQAFFRKRGLRPLPAYRVVYLPLGIGHALARLRAGLHKRLARRGWRKFAAMAANLRWLAPLSSFSRARVVRRFSARLPDNGRVVEACQQVPEAAAGIISASPGGVVWRPAMLNWLLAENERLGRPELKQALPGRYHFQAATDGRAYSACLLHEHGQLRGVALFHHHHIHDQATLSILLCFVPDAGWLPQVAAHALALALKHGADVIRAGTEFEPLFKDLAKGANLPTRSRQGYIDIEADPHAFDHYRESLADGDIALY